MARKERAREAFEIGDVEVAPGTRRKVLLPFGHLATGDPLSLQVHVIHGKRPGPVLFVSATLHGDEVIGVETIRRLLALPSMNRLSGTLLAVPVVNALGFMSHSRALPDRRDLNRSFPGRADGSLAARLAHLFVSEILERCTHGIDFHSGAQHRSNLPQLRLDLDDTELTRMAHVFAPPVIVKSVPPAGSMRETAMKKGVPVLLHEAGEALRYEESFIRSGLQGTLRVLHDLGMLRGRAPRIKATPVVARSSQWVRAPASGLFRGFRPLGAAVEEGELLGMISDPFGDRDTPVEAMDSGIMIGRSSLPIVNRGDALFHVARVKDGDAAAEKVEQIMDHVDGEDPFSDDPPMV